MKKITQFFSFFLLSLVGLTACAEGTSDLEEGKHYLKMYDEGSEKPVVMEFFSYGCVHCYNFEQFINDVKPRLPKETTFEAVPVALHPTWDIYVKAYYVGEMLNVLDTSHIAMFSLVHDKKIPISNEAELKAFFLSIGVADGSYEKVITSDELKSKIARSKELARKFKIMATPSFVVNEQHKLDLKQMGSYQMLAKAMIELPVNK